jgi:hypothetical protein
MTSAPKISGMPSRVSSSADVGELCCGSARRRAGIEYDAGRAEQVAEAAELAGLFRQGHARDQAFDPVRLRQRSPRCESEAGDHRTGLEKRTAGKLHEDDILGRACCLAGEAGQGNKVHNRHCERSHKIRHESRYD